MEAFVAPLVYLVFAAAVGSIYGAIWTFRRIFARLKKFRKYRLYEETAAFGLALGCFCKVAKIEEGTAKRAVAKPIVEPYEKNLKFWAAFLSRRRRL
ncbi:MAG: hypothetical protein LBM19_02020 [Holosporales bacterium]|nr:hypothetical protein [Holosporales bacterium]